MLLLRIDKRLTLIILLDRYVILKKMCSRTQINRI